MNLYKKIIISFFIISIFLFSNIFIIYAAQSLEIASNNLCIVDNIFDKYAESELKYFISGFIDSSMNYYDSFGFDNANPTNIIIKGPYKIYSLQDANTVKVGKIDYHILSNGKVINIITIYLDKYGELCGEQRIGYADKINKIFNKIDFTLFEDRSGLYAVFNNKTKITLKDYSNLCVSMDMIDYFILYDDLDTTIYNTIIKYNKNFNIYTYDYFIKKQSYFNRSITIPGVAQGTSACHEACIAAVVQVRKPNLYSNLTAAQVKQAINASIDDNDRAGFIKSKMHTIYLDNGEYSHYSYAYSSSLSVSSYVSIINNDDVIIAVCTNSTGTLYHATVMFDYSLIAGGVRVIMMDPIDGGTVNVSWTGGDFSYTMGWYTLTLDDYVISYY